MRIALIADEDPGWGGIGTYTGILGSALQDLGHEVVLVLRGWEQDGTETLGRLAVRRVVVPEPSWRRGTVALGSRLYTARESLVFSARAARVLRELAPDVVEAPEFHAPGLVSALRHRAFRRSAPPIVTRLHAPSFLTARLAAERPDPDLHAVEVLESLAALCARRITSPSRALAALVSPRWPWARRARVVPNPIDDELFSPASSDAEEATGRILVVGRIERAKGHDLLLEALPAIRAAVPDAHLRFVGQDGGLAEPLQVRAAELGVADAVEMVGALARDRLPSEYRSAMLCAVPSRFEAFPYTCVEAMACGRPVLAARVGGIGEMIESGHDGLLVGPGDPAALAEAVISLLCDERQRKRLGAAARERVRADFAAGPVAGRMVELYEEVAR